MESETVDRRSSVVVHWKVPGYNEFPLFASAQIVVVPFSLSREDTSWSGQHL